MNDYDFVFVNKNNKKKDIWQQTLDMVKKVMLIHCKNNHVQILIKPGKRVQN